MNIIQNVTIYTLASELGMTPSMVSRAFNPNARIAKDKREAVLKLAGKYGFSPNRLASRLSGRTLKIGILLVYKAEHVIKGLMEGFKEAFEATKDYKTEYVIKMVKASEKRASECREELFSFAEYDGVILMGFSSESCSELLYDFSLVNSNIVFVQNVCEGVPHLFASKHDEELSASIAAQLLYERLYHKERKNILLFTGDLSSSVHKRARSAFYSCAEKLGMTVIDTVDMKDSEEYLCEGIGDILARYGEDTDGIYITSGNSMALCNELSKSGLDVSLVLSDVHDSVCNAIRERIAFATLCQNFSQQAKTAFQRLVEYLAGGDKPQDTYYSDVIPVLSANLDYYKNK